MKRLLVLAGALFAFTVLAESCSSHKVARPPVHPRPPRKFVKATTPPAPPAVPVVDKIG